MQVVRNGVVQSLTRRLEIPGRELARQHHQRLSLLADENGLNTSTTKFAAEASTESIHV
jgi:hypothetical protein